MSDESFDAFDVSQNAALAQRAIQAMLQERIGTPLNLLRFEVNEEAGPVWTSAADKEFVRRVVGAAIAYGTPDPRFDDDGLAMGPMAEGGLRISAAWPVTCGEALDANGKAVPTLQMLYDVLTSLRTTFVLSSTLYHPSGGTATLARRANQASIEKQIEQTKQALTRALEDLVSRDLHEAALSGYGYVADSSLVSAQAHACRAAARNALDALADPPDDARTVFGHVAAAADAERATRTYRGVSVSANALLAAMHYSRTRDVYAALLAPPLREDVTRVAVSIFPVRGEHAFATLAREETTVEQSAPELLHNHKTVRRIGGSSGVFEEIAIHPGAMRDYVRGAGYIVAGSGVTLEERAATDLSTSILERGRSYADLSRAAAFWVKQAEQHKALEREQGAEPGDP